jgi:hypothetical protein
MYEYYKRALADHLQAPLTQEEQNLLGDERLIAQVDWNHQQYDEGLDALQGNLDKGIALLDFASRGDAEIDNSGVITDNAVVQIYLLQRIGAATTRHAPGEEAGDRYWTRMRMMRRRAHGYGWAENGLGHATSLQYLSFEPLYDLADQGIFGHLLNFRTRLSDYTTLKYSDQPRAHPQLNIKV